MKNSIKCLNRNLKSSFFVLIILSSIILISNYSSVSNLTLLNNFNCKRTIPRAIPEGEYINHESIDIRSDSELIAVASSGNGTSVAPLIIECLNITTSENIGIGVFHTRLYFIIRFCWIKTTCIGMSHAIAIGDNKPGTVKIQENICSESDYGIFLSNSYYSVICDNFIFNCTTGMYMYNSNHNIIRGNSFFDNTQGVFIIYSENSVLIQNKCFRNKQYGLMVLDLESYIADNVCYDNEFSYGIYINANNSNIVKNHCENNGLSGIAVHYSANVSVNYNNCSSNRGAGIILSNSDHCEMTNNILMNNSFEGLGIYSVLDGYRSTYNIIYSNNFLWNNNGSGEGSQGLDDGLNNQWYKNELSIGNYWSDRTVNSSYLIAGSAGSSDVFPLDMPIEIDLDIVTITTDFPILTEWISSDWSTIMSSSKHEEVINTSTDHAQALVSGFLTILTFLVVIVIAVRRRYISL